MVTEPKYLTNSSYSLRDDLNHKAGSESHAVTQRTDTPQTVTVTPRPAAARADPPSPAPARADSRRFVFADVGPALNGLASKYGIQISWHERVYTGNLSAEPPDPYWLTNYTPIFVAELGRYPVEMVQRAHLTTIVLCRDLANYNTNTERQMAILDIPGGTLYFSVDFSNTSIEDVRRTIHHEFFHLIDFWSQRQSGADVEWNQLNAFGFHYGYGGKYMRDANAGVADDSRPGFLDRYSTSSEAEDRAQIFAYLVASPQVIARRAARDPIIWKKIERLSLRLEQFSPGSTNILWGNPSR